MNRYGIERHDSQGNRWRSARVLLLPLLLFAIVGGLIWREVRQQELNQDLVAAVRRNDARTAIALLEEGADANARLLIGRQPSWWSMLNSSLRGRSDTRSGTPVLVLALGLQDQGTRDAPTSHYTLTQNPDLVKALVMHGARVNTPSPFWGWTPLMLASQSNQRDIVQFLLDHHADPNLKNREGQTAMDLAPHIRGQQDWDWKKMDTFLLLKKAGVGQ